MLISESRFRKIINEELKKLMKEAAPAAQVATKPKGTARTQAQIDAENEKSRRIVENTVNGWVSFLTKKGKQTNAQVLKRKWNEIKNNQYEDKDTLYQWADPKNIGTGMGLMGYLTGLVDPHHTENFQQSFGVPFSEEAIATQLGIQTQQDASAVNTFYSANAFATSLFNIVNMQMGSQLNVKKQYRPDEKGGMAPRNAAPGAPPAPAPAPAANPVAAASTAAPAQTIPYTVRQGDSITKILQTYYGFDPRLWNTLQPAEVQSISRMFGTNNPDVIIPKQQVNLLSSIVLGQKQYKFRQPATKQNPANVNR